MTLEELQNKLLDVQAENKKLSDDLQAIATQKAELEKSLENEKTTNQKRITDLQEHNQKLFLRITHQKEEKIINNQDFKSKLLGDYAKGLSEKELQILQDLEEGI